MPPPTPPAPNDTPIRDVVHPPSPPVSNDTPSVMQHLCPHLLHPMTLPSVMQCLCQPLLHPTTPPPMMQCIRQPPHMSNICDASPLLMLPAPNSAPVHDATPSIPPCPHLQQT
ncbi:hypothetical protein BDN70DRAFT_939800 [Pholiota conissans]|uniref:Uncharacterized protein n=1 Tax=Pholiota conissans TaxID=109636 RepID=A0A9P6CRS0_9AGAR|nr:hypothetical protein BDN70DRAFT_939800 [Pholiota conissans]